MKTSEVWPIETRRKSQDFRVWFKQQPRKVRERILLGLHQEHVYLTWAELPAWCDEPINKLADEACLSVRTSNVLYNATDWAAPVRTVRDLLALPHAKVLAMSRNCGLKTIREIVEAFAERDVEWPTEGMKMETP